MHFHKIFNSNHLRQVVQHLNKMGPKKSNRGFKKGPQAQQSKGASESPEKSGLHKVSNSSYADNTRQNDHKQSSAVHNEGQKSSFNPRSQTGHQPMEFDENFPPLQSQAADAARNFGKLEAKYDTTVGETTIVHNNSSNEASAIHTEHLNSLPLVENKTNKNQQPLSELIALLCSCNKSNSCDSTFTQILCEMIESHDNREFYIEKLSRLTNSVQRCENMQDQQLQKSMLSPVAQEFKSKEPLNMPKQEQPDEDNWDIENQNENVRTGDSYKKSEEVEKMEVCNTEDTPNKEHDWFDDEEPNGEKREREQSNDRQEREEVNRGQNRNYQQERDRGQDINYRQARERGGDRNYQQERDRDIGNNRGRQRQYQNQNRENWRGGQDGRSQERDRRNWNQDGRFDDKRKNQTGKPRKVKEMNGDLFEAPKDYSLAHCVATDLRMGSGIAVTFRQQFKKVTELLDQRKRVGEVAILEEDGRFIYYLITKKYSNGKPRFDDLVSSLEKMRDHCAENGIKNLAMPRIGCGLDRLEWREVKPAIEKVFSELDINIVVYNFNPDLDEASNANSKGKNSCRITNAPYPLIDIEHGTGLIYFGYEDGEMDDSGAALNKKFNFVYEFRTQKRVVGNVVRIQKRDEILYGCIINKKKSDTFSYVNFEKCLHELRKIGKKDGFYYYGIQAFFDDGDEITMEKIITVLRSAFIYVDCDIYICWPKELSANMEKGMVDDSAHSTNTQK